MGTHTGGWPAAEGMVMRPSRPGSWPLVTQILLVPFADQVKTDISDLETLQVVVVARDEWEQMQQAVAAAKGGA